MTRNTNGTFSPGSSGNLNGRPSGHKNRATIMAQNLLDGECRALVRKAIDLALGGDLVAIKLCLERILPRRHERALSFAMPDINTPQDAGVALAAIVKAVGAGELTPSEARTLAALVETALRTIETTEHETRITALEKR